MKSRMLSSVLLPIVGLAWTALTVAATPATLPVEELRPGMRGVAYTVFEGVRPEKMEVEVLGVLKNVIGPRKHVVLVRLHGQKAEFTGVVAGMSGSPVYIDGKLVGALSLRFGAFTREPIGGITPIESMLRAAAQDTSSVAEDSTPPLRYAVPEESAAASGLRASDPYLVPIE
ncbi:MAG: SpoIVB peptidase S55 domain-containing protein, partial [Nevskiales bacterium]